VSELMDVFYGLNHVVQGFIIAGAIILFLILFGEVILITLEALFCDFLPKAWDAIKRMGDD
jgi:hypothetical protein